MTTPPLTPQETAYREGWEAAARQLRLGLPGDELGRAAVEYVHGLEPAEDPVRPAATEGTWADNLEQVPARLVAAMSELVTHDDDALHRLGVLASVRALPGADLEVGDLLEVARFVSTGLLPGEEAPRG